MPTFLALWLPIVFPSLAPSSELPHGNPKNHQCLALHLGSSFCPVLPGTCLDFGSLETPSSILFFFVFLRPHLLHMEVPRLGVRSELQLPAYTTATATLDP